MHLLCTHDTHILCVSLLESRLFLLTYIHTKHAHAKCHMNTRVDIIYTLYVLSVTGNTFAAATRVHTYTFSTE